MEIFKVIGFAIIAVVIITILKSLKKDDFALIVTVIASALLLGFLLHYSFLYLLVYILLYILFPLLLQHLFLILSN